MNTFTIYYLSTVLVRQQSPMRLFRASFNRSSPILNKRYYCIQQVVPILDEKEEKVADSHAAGLKQSVNPMVEKFTKLLGEMVSNDESEKNDDKLYLTDFGSIRFDSDNNPSLNADVDNSTSAETVVFDPPSEVFSESAELHNIDKYYFENLSTDACNSEPVSSINISTKCDELKDLNFVDGQYIKYGETNDAEINTIDLPKLVNIDRVTANLNYIDDQYFNSTAVTNQDDILQNSLINDTEQDRTEAFSFDESLSEETLNHSKKIISAAFSDKTIDRSEISDRMFNLYDSVSLAGKTSNSSTKTNNNKNLSEEIASQPASEANKSATVSSFELNKTKSNSEDDIKVTADGGYVNALHFVKEKRKEELKKENLKSEKIEKYKRIIHEVPIFSHLLRYDMVKMLKANILYNDNDIIGLNKPYGIPVHGSGGDAEKHARDHFNLANLLPDLAQSLKIEKLYPIHRLDLNTTGVILYAKTEVMANKLKALFKSRRMKKQYLCICKGIPSPLKGVINIPIGMGAIENTRRMALRPDIDGYRGKIGQSRQAITKYKVLSSANSSSFMELIPATGVKHQLRVHLGFGLGCPILGDHKYTHIQKLVPQKLSSDMLDCLNLKQSRVRDLPMFLHSSSISIPDILDIRDITIGARVPKHFNFALKFLGLWKRSNYEMKSPDEGVYDLPSS